MGAQGSSTLAFGSAPGTNQVTVTVTGQTGIVSGSHVEAFIMAETSSNHSAYEHQLLASYVKLCCGNIVAGTGFDVVGITELRLSGNLSIRWVWN